MLPSTIGKTIKRVDKRDRVRPSTHPTPPARHTHTHPYDTMALWYYGNTTSKVVKPEHFALPNAKPLNFGRCVAGARSLALRIPVQNTSRRRRRFAVRFNPESFSLARLARTNSDCDNGRNAAQAATVDQGTWLPQFTFQVLSSAFSSSGKSESFIELFNVKVAESIVEKADPPPPLGSPPPSPL